MVDTYFSCVTKKSQKMGASDPTTSAPLGDDSSAQAAVEGRRRDFFQDGRDFSGLRFLQCHFRIVEGGLTSDGWLDGA